MYSEAVLLIKMVIGNIHDNRFVVLYSEKEENFVFSHSIVEE
jgi:hypothetical protein